MLFSEGCKADAIARIIFAPNRRLNSQMNIQILNKRLLHLSSGQPLSFGTVFTAFGVVILGHSLSVALLLSEIIIARFGLGMCTRAMNAYNNQISM